MAREAAFGRAFARGIGVCALCAALGLALIVSAGCSGGTAAGAPGKGGRGGRGGGEGGPVPVSVATVTQMDIPVTVGTFGTVEPYATVAVKSQVGGVLAEVHVTEGQNVKAGDLLFVIDSRPYQATLGVAEANLERDTAEADLAGRELKRTEELLKTGIGAPSDYDKDQTNAAATKAAVAADKQAIESAKLSMGYCRITAPIDGRTGVLFVNAGNTVMANDATLITINQVKPIRVAFSLPERELDEVRKYSTAGPLDVKATVPASEDLVETGKLTFIDNAVSSETGTIAIKGTFDNTDERLWPGQHVNVELFLTTEKGALVAPVPAVQDSQTGKYAYVVKPDMTVESREVVPGPIYGDNVVIEKGLALGDTVVIEGHLRLVPGAKVSVKAPIAEAAQAGSAPAVDAGGATPAAAKGGHRRRTDAATVDSSSEGAQR